MEKFKFLEAKKLISEYSFLLDEEEWKNEMIEENRKKFLNAINSKTSPEPESPENSGEKEIQESKKPKKFEIEEESKKKLKKVYYQIASLTHPDKVSDPELNGIYQKSAKFYEENNILEIYRIARDLKIRFDLGPKEVEKIKEIIEEKRRYLKSLESTWLWIWIHAPTEEEREKIVESFIEKNSKK